VEDKLSCGAAAADDDLFTSGAPVLRISK